MKITSPFIIMCLVTLMLGIDVVTLTSVIQEILTHAGLKDKDATGMLVLYVSHLLAFVGMCYATYKVHQET